jgi:hypothetical protein
MGKNAVKVLFDIAVSNNIDINILLYNALDVSIPTNAEVMLDNVRIKPFEASSIISKHFYDYD